VVAQGGSQQGQGGSAEGPGSAQTSDERRASKDKRLNDSLGEFDAKLKKEREATAQERDARDAARAGSAEGESEGNEEGEEGTDGEEGQSGDKTGSGTPPTASNDGSGKSSTRPGDLRSEKQTNKTGSSAGTGSGSGAAAREIPDGSDDDIVARRLRKAAEQETDPELKDKLWKEYIEYKKNGQGK
jgi:hypothetical protein